MSKKNRDHYLVGRGKPPREYCFKPGQSGNPKGKKKGVQNLATILKEELSRVRKITEDGKMDRYSEWRCRNARDIVLRLLS